jgi:hypothetical protein
MEFDVWYKGRIIGNIHADTLKKAENLARKIYGPDATATKC